MPDLSSLLASYGYWGIFAFLATGIFGIPVADEVILMGAGYLVSQGELQAAPTLLAVLLGSLSGTSLNYLVGRTIGLKVVGVSGRFFRNRGYRLEQVQGWFQRVGKWGLPVGYFFPGIRHLAPVVAGVSRLHLGIFALLTVSGCCLWCMTLLTLGYFVGEERTRLWEWLHSPLLLLPLLVLLTGLLYLWVRRRLRPKDYAAAGDCSAKR
jgi:membrane protein DedA with SNARE-associated domain